MTLSRPLIRVADPAGSDAVAISRLVGAYLRQTELEKAHHLGGTDLAHDAALPERYRDEVESPARAYLSAAVHLAELGRSAVGVIVLQRTADALEIKRVWVAPEARGHRVGSALIDSAVRDADLPTRLTVWDWRSDAIGLYERRGFTRVPSWEERARLVCMVRPPNLA